MYYENNTAKDVKLAYIGGGSQGWAWTFMNDLKQSSNMSGTVYLYDIDYPKAEINEGIGNRIDGDAWKYKAAKTAEEALTGADFVIICNCKKMNLCAVGHKIKMCFCNAHNNFLSE